MGTWTNSDGLYVKFGTTEAQLGNAGEYNTLGNIHITEFVIDATDLADTNAILDRNVVIASGSTIHKVEVIAETACTSGGSAVLDIGLDFVNNGQTDDDDALVAALALTSIDAEGDIVELIQGGTGHGVLVGTTISDSAYVTAGYDTAVYTAGRLVVRIHTYVKATAI